MEMEHLFKENEIFRKKKGMQNCLKEAEREIIEYLIPYLQRYGIRSERSTLAGQALALSKYKEWDSLYKRMKEDRPGIGLFLSLEKDPTKRIYVQPFMRDDLSSDEVGYAPEASVPHEIRSFCLSTKSDIVTVMWNFLKEIDAYFLVRTLHGTFWFSKYSDVPVTHYKAGYKNDKTIVNRIYVKPEFKNTFFNANIEQLPTKIIQAINESK